MRRRRRYYKGRRISKGEKRIAEFFDSYNIPYVREKSFDGCTSLKGNLLRFDFYLEQFNLLIEYQGQHHIKPINKYNRALRVHKTTILHDKIKDIFATGRKINFIKIYYMDYNNIEMILKSIFNINEKLEKLEAESLKNGN